MVSGVLADGLDAVLPLSSCRLATGRVPLHASLTRPVPASPAQVCCSPSAVLGRVVAAYLRSSGLQGRKCAQFCPITRHTSAVLGRVFAAYVRITRCFFPLDRKTRRMCVPFVRKGAGSPSAFGWRGYSSDRSMGVSLLVPSLVREFCAPAGGAVAAPEILVHRGGPCWPGSCVVSVGYKVSSPTNSSNCVLRSLESASSAIFCWGAPVSVPSRSCNWRFLLSRLR